MEHGYPRGFWGEFRSDGNSVQTISEFTSANCIARWWLANGYTHWCESSRNVPVNRRNFDELNEAHKKALERLTNQERDHQILIKKFKERIAELELGYYPPKHLEDGYGVRMGMRRFNELIQAERERDHYCRERDLARKTLDDVRALINGQKL